jgi:hypothetical protein
MIDKAHGDRSTKTVSFATGLRPGWNAKSADATVNLKEPQKKLRQAHVEILAGGLEDSDIEGPNPFPQVPQTRKTITEKELRDGSNMEKRNTSRRNEVCILL